MKYCTKCGYELVNEARFCNACGAEVVKTEAVSENPYAGNTQPVYQVQPAPVYSEAPKSDDEQRAEEQKLLDKFSIGLKHERMAWKFTGIFYLVYTIFIAFCGLIMGVCGIGIDDYSGEAAFIYTMMANMYFVAALFLLPITIINFSMAKKLAGYRAKLYTDCKDGIGHFSVGSIVFCAFFNGVALVFNIVYFIQAKNNAAVIERIKARQEEYNSRQ